MKAHPMFLAITTLTLATPAVIHSAQGDAPASSGAASADPIVQPDAPRAGIVTVIEHRPMQERHAADQRWRIAWKSLAALPAAERDRLRGLVRAVDRANRTRAPRPKTPMTTTTTTTTPRTFDADQPILAPRCMGEI